MLQIVFPDTVQVQDFQYTNHHNNGIKNDKSYSYVRFLLVMKIITLQCYFCLVEWPWRGLTVGLQDLINITRKNGR